MFLQAVAERNPRLLEWAAAAHRSGLIPPETYVLDLDALEENSRLIARAGQRAGLEIWFMSKQLARNPAAIERIRAAGLHSAVCVDMPGALALHPQGVRIGHLGHLVQIPDGYLEHALSMKPEAITVFTYEKAAAISRVAAERGESVNLLLRVVGPRDRFFPGQEGGIPQSEAVATARRLEALPGVTVTGLTSFPCLDYDARTKRVRVLPNARTVARVAEALTQALGRSMEHVVLPGINTSSTFELIRSLGATHAEPGHALTGTTPLHAAGDQPETPAMLYVTEVSHCHQGRAYCYGGGLYKRAQAATALVGANESFTSWRRYRVVLPSPANIWYYAALHPTDTRLPAVGETVLMAPRTQLFNLRCNLAVVTHKGGEPKMTLYRTEDLPFPAPAKGADA